MFPFMDNILQVLNIIIIIFKIINVLKILIAIDIKLSKNIT